jgi:hypothetical protein
LSGLAADLSAAPAPDGRVVRPASSPLHPTAGVVVTHRNLALGLHEFRLLARAPRGDGRLLRFPQSHDGLDAFPEGGRGEHLLLDGVEHESDSEGDDFIKNLLTVRIEERCAFAIYKPTGFASVTGLTTP